MTTETKSYNPWPLVTQISGAVAAGGGLYLLLGLAWTLLLVGVGTVALSALSEWKGAS